jgi:hypothetical protein
MQTYRFLELLQEFMGLGLLGPRHVPLHGCDGRQDRGECLPTFLAGHDEKHVKRLSSAEWAFDLKRVVVGKRRGVAKSAAKRERKVGCWCP